MSRRIHHLDALRSFAMLFGLFVHADGLFAREVFPLVGLASEHFRMASFFLVSGFFSSLVAERTSDAAMVARRTLALMLPFCAMLVLVHPVTLYLVHLRHEGFMTFAEFLATRWQPAAFLHLWFLPALWFYVLLAPPLRAVLSLRSLRRLARDAVRWRPDLLIGALTVAAGFATVALQGLFRPAIALLGWRFDWLIFETLRYLPFFALGVALQITPALFARFHHVSLPVLALAAVLAFAAGGLAAEISPAAQAGLELFVREALTLPVVAGLLWAFRRFFSAPSRPVEVLTGSIYTVYLFHYLALYAFALLLAPVLKSDVALYFACVALALSATFTLHRLVVARVPLLRLLFNGRPMGVRAPGA